MAAAVGGASHRQVKAGGQEAAARCSQRLHSQPDELEEPADAGLAQECKVSD